MTSDQSLRPYALAVGVALGLYILLNLAVYWIWVRPEPSAATASQPAPAVEQPPEEGPGPAAGQAQVAAPPAFAIVSGAGEWTQEGDVITQGSSQLADLFAGSNRGGSQYTAAVDVLWPPAAETMVGGGFVFHMPSAGELAGAQMVRFSRNGQEAFWGYFNESGAFQGEGGAALALEPGKPHTLSVVIRASTFDVLVDGETVATQRPLHRQSGLLGLITYGGPITFTNLRTDAGLAAPAAQ